MRQPQDHELPLSDGRTLSYWDLGDPGGKPLVYCHGFPSSRREAILAAAAADQLGLRLIAPDRPGFGRSSHLPARRIGDWPKDLEALADALGIDRFSVLGISGGGPYALACAADLAPRLERVTVVGGVGPASIFSAAIHVCSRVARLTYGTARRSPALSRVVCAGLAGGLRRDPHGMLTALTRAAPECDRTALGRGDVGPVLAAALQEAVHRGSRGAWWELQLFTREWGFDLAAIAMPVRLWHGEADTVVPVANGRHVERLLPRCQATFIPDEGHYSLPVNHQLTILRELASPL